ncbi:oligosaccharide flippase family protein [Acidovorax sp.]|uniref:oligosaccharide flippase family protein n=1 Tax=Acidovorax sp. TaxID=1872122 RepID=UPI003BB1E7B2
MTDRNQFGPGVVWSYLQSWAARGITTFSFLIVGWYIGPAEFGLFSLVAAMLLFTEMLCEQALSQTVVQLPIIDQSRLSIIFLMGLGGSACIAIALALSADMAAEFFMSPALSLLLKTVALCPIIIGLTAVPIGLLRRDMAFKLLARRTVLSSGVSSLFGISLVIAGFGAWGLVAQAICYYAVGLLVLWRGCTWRPTWLPDLVACREIWHLSAWNAANKISDFAETRGLEIIVGAIGGIHALGIFAFASKVAQTAYQTVAAPVLEVVFSEVARQRSPDGITNAVRNGQLIIASLPSALMLGLACISGSLLFFMYGDRWLDAAHPLAILSLALMSRGLIYVLGSALLAVRASRAVVTIAATRAMLSVLFCFLGLKNGMGPDSAAWSYLVSALLVAPVSSLVLSKKIGVSLKILIAVPLKVCVATLVGVAIFLAGQWFANGVLATAFAAMAASTVFLLSVIGLNAGLLVYSLQNSSRNGAIGKLLGWLHNLASAIMGMRERMHLHWFNATLRLSIALHKSNVSNQQTVLVVPADTAELDGSLGDQALLLGFGALRNAQKTTIVVSEKFHASAVFSGTPFVKGWNGLAAGWVLGKQAASASELYIIGADVMDGYYSPGVSRQRLMLVKTFARAGVPCGIMGFSFNATPHPSVVEEFRRLPETVRICLRDAVSLERFERLIGRRAQLVSDLAFLVHGVDSSEVSAMVKPWVQAQRLDDRRILGVNVNPQVVAHLAADRETAIAESVAKACHELIGENISIVLIPHDFRPGCADFRVMKMVWNSLPKDAQRHVLLLEKPFTAQEIKSVCKNFELVFSARMHLAIGALSVHTPVCGMQYQGKFAGLFQHFEFGNDIFISPEDALDPQRLGEFLRRHMNNAQTLKEQVVLRLPAVQELAKMNVAEQRR